MPVNTRMNWSLFWIFPLVLLAVVVFAGPSGRLAAPLDAGDIDFVLEPLASGFNAPTDLAFDPETNQPFVTERLGTIVTIADGAPAGTPFLDITDRVGSLETQQGLFSLAFHPDYAANRYLFVHYTDLNGDTQVSRFTANPAGTAADPDSELPILALEQPYDDNNGGDIVFGPDGYLYIPLGDGGDLNDPDSNAQSGDTLLGKILRIDVDGGSPYAIPPDNPYVGDPEVLDEIWAFGLRNPWRISFDRETGDLYIADVGQYEREEVNFQPASSGGGENYGWSCFEDSLVNPDTNWPNCGPAGAYDQPFFDYDHNPYGCAVTGGYVYRGAAHPDLAGRYIFNDWCTGYFWDAVQTSPGNWIVTEHDELTNTGMSFGNVGYGEDNRGELYVVGNNAIYCFMSCVTDSNSYLPAMLNGPAAIDLSIDSLEVTQAIQTNSMNVPLIANRPALLRIYAETSEDAPTTGVRVEIAASRNGVALAGSPLSLSNQTVAPNALRSDLDTTINVSLPAGWTQGNVDLQVFLDPANAVVEWDEDNNQWQSDLSFTTVPPMNITIVPVRYTHQPNGQTYPPPTVDTISDFIMRTYPVATINITFHSSYTFVGNLDLVDEWRRLLNELTTLRNADGPPPDVFYYGLVPVLNGDGEWFDGGVAGIGWVGSSRTAVGLDLATIWHDDYSGELAVHEIGHNLRRLHAPCGVNSALDPDYPYADGKIGQWGLDLTTTELLSPSTTYDFMGYCHRYWISDYTYRALLTELTAPLPGGPAGRQDSLLVRAVLDEAQGRAEFGPVYALPGRLTPLPEASDYVLELLDETGRVLAAHPVERHYAAEEGVELAMIIAMLPQPAGETVASLRLRHNGREMATYDLAAPAEASAVAVADGTLSWSAATPALVGYTPDNGQTWQTLAVDAAGELPLPAGLDLEQGEVIVLPGQ